MRGRERAGLWRAWTVTLVTGFLVAAQTAPSSAGVDRLAAQPAVSVRAPVPAAAAVPGWTGPVEVAPPRGLISALACGSAASCLAVDQHGFAFAYDAGSWSPGQRVSASPLSSVSCAVPSWCVTVGRGGYAVFDGVGWSAPRPVPGVPVPEQVSCPSASFCLVADRDGASAAFDGATWSAVPGPGPTNLFFDVSCVSRAFCLAVDGAGAAHRLSAGRWVPAGSTGLASGHAHHLTCVSRTFCLAVDRSATVFDGTSWSTPVRLTTSPDEMGLTCVDLTFCLATESFGTVHLYDGSAWSVPPNLQSADRVGLVDCFSRTFCVATARVDGSVHSFDGTGWSPRLVIDRFQTGDLTGSSCPTRTFCMVIDSSGFAVRYTDGKWTQRYIGSPFVRYQRVSCTGPTFCLAIGDGGWTRYDGTRWLPVQALGLLFGLGEVSCVSATFCVGVGGHQVGIFDGQRWLAPIDLPALVSLSMVSCVDPGFCIAADATIPAEIHAFDGAAWHRSARFSTGRAFSSLACASRTFCMAVTFDGQETRFDGTRWSPMRRIGGTAVSGLTGLACAPGPAHFCQAIDVRSATAFTFRNGAWTRRPGVGGAQFAELSCADPTFCISPSSSGRVWLWR